MKHGERQVLIVDDEPDIGLLMEMILKPAGFRVRHARSLQQARQEVAEYQFDTIFLDLNLNGQLGLDLLPNLEDQPEDMKLVVITAQLDSALLQQVQENGLKNIIEKPFTKNEILEALN